MKTPTEVFTEFGVLILICLWRTNRPRISQDNLEEKQGREIYPTRFQDFLLNNGV